MNKKRVLSIALAIIVLGATILSFIIPIIAYGDEKPISELMECRVVDAEKTNDRYKYDLTLTFESVGDKDNRPITFKDVYPECYTSSYTDEDFRRPIVSFDRNSDIKSSLSLNNSSSANSAFYNYSDIVIRYIDPTTQKENNNFRFQVLVKDAEYDGEGNNMSIKSDVFIKKPNSSDDYFKLSTNGYNKVQIPSDELDHILDNNGSTVERPKSATPYIIITDYKVSNNQLYAGDSFTLDLKMDNTSRTTDIENIIMKVSSSDGFSVLDSSNTFYFDRLPVRSGIQKSLKFQVMPTAETRVYPINIAFTYEYVSDKARTQGSCEEVINLSANQKERFEISPVQVPPQIFPGEEMPIDIECINKGKNQIYNVSATINGNISNPNQYEYVGNIQPGGTNTISMFISGDEPNADINGEVLISYEDEIGNIKTKSVPFQTKTMEMPDMNQGFPDGDMGETMPGEMGDEIPTEGSSLTTTQKVIFIVGGVLALAVIYKAIKVHKEKKEFEDDDEIN